jgi:hypothetical protein
MNERIQKLAEQALNEYNATYHNEAKIPEAYLKKFAELIVEQCFRVALIEGKGYLDPVKLRNAMKQHFGVEE